MSLCRVDEGGSLQKFLEDRASLTMAYLNKEIVKHKNPRSLDCQKLAEVP